jgi:hypothetical protein
MDDYYLVEAKKEYTSYLITTLTPSIYTGFKDLFEQSKKILNGNSVFKNFQILLSNVPKWNNYMLEKELSDITKETGCDWLDNLITAVFVSHSKILTSVKVGNYRPKNKKIDLKIPDTTSFIHQCYVQSAREFYKNPMLFLDDQKMVRPDEILKNQNIIQSVIKESIMSTIRKLLPFRNILNEYLALDAINSTIFIGNTSVATKTIDNTPSIPAITLPEISNVGHKDEHTLLSSLEKETPIVVPPQPKKEDSISEEKDVSVVGKELDLFDMDINLDEEKQIPTIQKPNKKDLSLDSITVQQMVDNIKEEFNVNNKNNKDDSSLDLDDLSFLDNPKKEPVTQKQLYINNLDNLDCLDNLSIDTLPKAKKKIQPEINIDKISLDLDDIISKKSENKYLVKDIISKSESIDLEKIKQELLEDGTIVNNITPPKKSFSLTNIMPQIKEKSLDKKIDIGSNNQIKKISIKFNSSVPFKKSNKKKKTTLLDDANDSDSSEMIFK